MGSLRSFLNMIEKTLIIALTLNAFGNADIVTTPSERNQKVFSLFSVVTFPNEQCTGASSTASLPVLGTCFSSTECTSKSGAADGNCASGFGVCCTFTVTTCGSTVTNNCTYVQNPGYPSSYTTAGTCEYSVTPESSDICQLRLDFDNFDNTDDADGGCTIDNLKVTTGSGRVYTPMCGTNTGSHIYVETGRVTSGQKLAWTVQATGTSTTSTWRVKVSQIECFSTSKPPNDCFQYLTGKSGTINSFNWPTVMTADMEYTVCVRREAGYCGIEWAVSTATPVGLQLDGAGEALVPIATTAAPGANLGPGLAGAASVRSGTLAGAVLIIPGSENQLYSGNVLTENNAAAAPAQDRIPGATIRATGKPFRIEVNSSGVVAGVLGYNLVYNQAPCNTAFVGQ